MSQSDQQGQPRASERSDDISSDARKRKLEDGAQADAIAAESKLRRESASSPVSTSSNAVELSALSPATPPAPTAAESVTPVPAAAASSVDGRPAGAPEPIRVKIKLAKRRTEETDAARSDLDTMRTRAAAKRQMLLTSLLAERERDIRDLCILRLLPNGGNILEPSSFSSALPAEIAKYHLANPLELEAGAAEVTVKKEKLPALTTPVASAPKTLKAAVPKTPVAATPSSADRVAAAVPVTPAPDSPPPTPIRGSALSGTKKVELSVEEIAGKAAHDASILKRVRALQKEGLWLPKRLPAQVEPSRTKTHWDYLLEEMAWLAKDFSDERRWKIAAGRKLARAVSKHHKELELEEKRKTKDEEVALRKTASRIAREVKRFWTQIEKVVIYKTQQAEEEEKKAAREKQLNFLVDQTEKYSSMLAQELKDKPAVTTKPSSPAKHAAPAAAARLSSPPKKKNSDDVEMIEVAKDEEEEEESTSEMEQPASVAQLIHTEIAAEDAEEEFEVPKDAEIEEDVEDTLEAEEKLAEEDAKDGTVLRNETAELENEGKMPIEEVLKTFYGGEASLDEDEEEGSGDDADEAAAADDDSRSEKQIIDDAAKDAAAAQPTGFTLDTTQVKTKVPHLLRGTLREYQHVGLEWMASMYEKKLNGILADEMGLGKTIMSISILAHLACEKGIWGPHLVVVPTSVMINWEAEFKKWCPAFKILVYFGSQKERRIKRQGWSKPNSFHVCITSYKLVIQDAVAFRRKKWKYLILDEAQNIKNFRSQRWQVLLNFNAQRRLLLTGTPLQNSLMELWSLMHFLMPNIFASHQEFKEWFSKPVNQIIEGQDDYNADLINRLHAVLRPFILRRMKKDVEKQLPGKHEHIVPCALSKRQRLLYDEFMASAQTQSTLSSGNFLGIMNVLMQLRKVCNHPDLFESRPIVSPYDQLWRASLLLSGLLILQECLTIHIPSLAARPFVPSSLTNSKLDLDFLQLSNLPARERAVLSLLTSQSPPSSSSSSFSTRRALITELGAHDQPLPPLPPSSSLLEHMKHTIAKQLHSWRAGRFAHAAYVNTTRTSSNAVYGANLLRLLTVPIMPRDYAAKASDPRNLSEISEALLSMLVSYERRSASLRSLIEQFVFIIPRVRASPPRLHASHPDPSAVLSQKRDMLQLTRLANPISAPLWAPFVRTQLYFPDKRLIQYDCGKLQRLATLLRDLKAGGHRALIFTQMTKMLDVLEIFLNLHGHTYLRLDGSTKVEHRQKLTERFNRDPRVFLFILSTRSGGLGLNLTGADTVIFYDSDWNPAMDAQAQDRCHRIGQTREVHIYRLVSEYTIEENILKKATQKRYLDEVVIQEGQFTTDFFKKIDITDLIAERGATATATTVVAAAPSQSSKSSGHAPRVQVSQQEWEKAAAAAEDENDVLALQQAKKEEAQELDEFDEEKMAKEEAAARATAAAAAASAGGANGQLPPGSAQKKGPNGAELMALGGDEDGMMADAKTISDNNRKAEQGDIAGMLTAVQRYMMRFVESGATGAIELIEILVPSPAPQPDPEVDLLVEPRKEEEEDEEIFYQTKGTYHTLSYCVVIYGPPMPPEADELFQPDLSLLFGAVITEKGDGKNADGASTKKSNKRRSTIKATKASTKKEKEKDKNGDPGVIFATTRKTTPKRVLKESQTAVDDAGQFSTGRKRKGRQRGDAEEARADQSPWTLEEDAVLLSTLEEYGRNWDLITECVNALPLGCGCRSRRQCEARHRLVLAPRITAEEQPPTNAPTISSVPPILETARKHHATPPVAEPPLPAALADVHTQVASDVGVTPSAVPWPQEIAVRNMRPIPVPTFRDRLLEGLHRSFHLEYKLSQLTPGMKPPALPSPMISKPHAAAQAHAHALAQHSHLNPVPVSAHIAITKPSAAAAGVAMRVATQTLGSMQPKASPVTMPMGVGMSTTPLLLQNASAMAAVSRMPGVPPNVTLGRPVPPTALPGGYAPMPPAPKAKAKRTAKPKAAAGVVPLPLPVTAGSTGMVIGGVAMPAVRVPVMQPSGVVGVAGGVMHKPAAAASLVAAPVHQVAGIPMNVVATTTYVQPPTQLPRTATPTHVPTHTYATPTPLPYVPAPQPITAATTPMPLRQPTILSRAPSPNPPVPLPMPLALSLNPTQPPHQQQ